MFPPPIAKVLPPELFFNVSLNFSAISLAEAKEPPLGAFIFSIEFVISFPEPNINEPLELKVLFATPTIEFAIPEYEFSDVFDSIAFKDPVIVAPKFCTASLAPKKPKFPSFFPVIIEKLPVFVASIPLVKLFVPTVVAYIEYP